MTTRIEQLQDEVTDLGHQIDKIAQRNVKRNTKLKHVETVCKQARNAIANEAPSLADHLLSELLDWLDTAK